MTVSIEKLRQFQQQHLESQVQCGEEVKAVPKAGCVKEWALVEIALSLHALSEKLDKIVHQPDLRKSLDAPRPIRNIAGTQVGRFRGPERA